MAAFEVGIGLGSNIGDKAANIREAMRRLRADGDVALKAMSSLYRTAPWGVIEQDFFVNACAIVTTRLPPRELLARAKTIEHDMGRERGVRWGPRLIDIDLLYYGDLTVEDDDLKLPHLDLFNRAFVLVPLAEIAPGLVLGGRSVGAAAAAASSGEVARLDGGASHPA